MSTETRMRAIRQETLGGPEVLELIECRGRARPDGGPRARRRGGRQPGRLEGPRRGGFLGEPPFTVGWDVAGVVEEVGCGVTRFSPGDRVFGMPRFPREAAAMPSTSTSPSRQLARTPDGLADVEARRSRSPGSPPGRRSSRPPAVGAGQRVLVLGAAGGVGHLAVQIAKARGAYVIGTARAGQARLSCAELGVDEAVRLHGRGRRARVRDVDVVLDARRRRGRASAALQALRDGGMLVTVSASVGVRRGRRAAAGACAWPASSVEPDRAGTGGARSLGLAARASSARTSSARSRSRRPRGARARRAGQHAGQARAPPSRY